MVKLFAKTVKDHKTKAKYDYTADEKLEWAHFYYYVRDICQAMDIPTPLILKSHLFNFAKFNYVRFLKSDFVEEVDFDFLMVENVKL